MLLSSYPIKFVIRYQPALNAVIPQKQANFVMKVALLTVILAAKTRQVPASSALLEGPVSLNANSLVAMIVSYVIIWEGVTFARILAELGRIAINADLSLVSSQTLWIVLAQSQLTLSANLVKTLLKQRRDCL